MRLHLVDGLTVAEVARSLGLDQKALYRGKEKLLQRLRADLESAGIGSADANELLSAVDWDAEFFDDIVTDDPGPESAEPSPSRSLGGDTDSGEGES